MKKAVAASLVLSVWLAVVPSGQGTKPGASASADFVAPGPVVPVAAPIMTAASAIRAEALAAHIAFLAAPSLEGRGLGSRGLEASAEYIAAGLSLAGVPPLETGSRRDAPAAYFQPVPLLEISRPSGTLAIEARRADAVDEQLFLPVALLAADLPPMPHHPGLRACE